MDKQALKQLKKDPVMHRLIRQHGPLSIRRRRRSYLEHLIQSIINQQLSDKAADTIYKRFKRIAPRPRDVLKQRDTKIRECGISNTKIGYIKGLCKAVEDGSLNFRKLHKLSDEEVISELVGLKGIGRWTAEMFLMSSLGRVDIFSVGDLGLRTAVSRLYKVNRDDWKTIEQISLRWKPYRSIAARYLWRSLD